GAMADLAVPADDRRALDHRAVFDDRAFTDEHLVADVGAAFAFVAQGGFQVRGEIAFDLFEGVPGELAAVEDLGVFALAEIEQVGRREHGGKLGEMPAAANLYFWNRDRSRE